MEITCPQCNAVFQKSDAKIKFGLVFCPECEHKFKHEAATVFVDLPPNYTTYIEGRDLVIKKSWRNMVGFIVMTVFSIVWLIVPLTSIAVIVIDGSTQWGEKLIGVMFISVFLIIGLLILYGGLGMLLNTTETRVDDRYITISTYPLPSSFKKVVESSSVEQIYCREAIRNGSKGRTYIVYELTAILTDGRRVALESFDDVAHARAYETFMEKRLGIKNEAVDDEYTF